MKVVGSGKMAAASAVAGVALLAGGLFLGATLVSAEEPTPAAGQEQTAPGTTDDGPGRTHDGKECDEERDSSGAGSTGLRGGGMGRGLHQ
jgi:hypothetical protein